MFFRLNLIRENVPLETTTRKCDKKCGNMKKTIMITLRISKAWSPKRTEIKCKKKTYYEWLIEVAHLLSQRRLSGVCCLV